jgi:hypothetical protein
MMSVRASAFINDQTHEITGNLYNHSTLAPLSSEIRTKHSSNVHNIIVHDRQDNRYIQLAITSNQSCKSVIRHIISNTYHCGARLSKSSHHSANTQPKLSHICQCVTRHSKLPHHCSTIVAPLQKSSFEGRLAHHHTSNFTSESILIQIKDASKQR